MRNVGSHLVTPSKLLNVLIFFFLFVRSYGSSLHSHFVIFLSDTSKKDTTSDKIHKPSKAALYSTLLPGLGQSYNKKYWKIPIIYGVMGTLGYFAYDNHKQYTLFRDALRARYDSDPNTMDNFTNIDDQVLKAQREYYRRNRDFFIIMGVISYCLNILDAYVDAHLKGFSVSDTLTFKPIPSHNGIQVSLTWKLP